jgi:hypothetical protein
LLAGSWACAAAATEHEAEVRGLALHPSRKYAVSVSADASWAWWDLAEAKCLKQVRDTDRWGVRLFAGACGGAGGLVYASMEVGAQSAACRQAVDGSGDKWVCACAHSLPCVVWVLSALTVLLCVLAWMLRFGRGSMPQAGERDGRGMGSGLCTCAVLSWHGRFSAWLRGDGVACVPLVHTRQRKSTAAAPKVPECHTNQILRDAYRHNHRGIVDISCSSACCVCLLSCHYIHRCLGLPPMSARPSTLTVCCLQSALLTPRHRSGR